MKTLYEHHVKKRLAITTRFCVRSFLKVLSRCRGERAGVGGSVFETRRGSIYVTKLPLADECNGLGSHTPTVVVSMDT